MQPYLVSYPRAGTHTLQVTTSRVGISRMRDLSTNREFRMQQVVDFTLSWSVNVKILMPWNVMYDSTRFDDSGFSGTSVPCGGEIIIEIRKKRKKERKSWNFFFDTTSVPVKWGSVSVSSSTELIWRTSENSSKVLQSYLRIHGHYISSECSKRHKMVVNILASKSLRNSVTTTEFLWNTNRINQVSALRFQITLFMAWRKSLWCLKLQPLHLHPHPHPLYAVAALKSSVLKSWSRTTDAWKERRDDRWVISHWAEVVITAQKTEKL